MRKKTWISAAALLALLAVSGTWAAVARANSRSAPKAVDCCLDPTCPPGCSLNCPPDCTVLSPSVAKRPETAERLQPDKPGAATRKTCPPCPLCP